jgi:hypothetical protein
LLSEITQGAKTTGKCLMFNQAEICRNVFGVETEIQNNFVNMPLDQAWSQLKIIIGNQNFNRNHADNLAATALLKKLSDAPEEQFIVNKGGETTTESNNVTKLPVIEYLNTNGSYKDVIYITEDKKEAFLVIINAVILNRQRKKTAKTMLAVANVRSTTNNLQEITTEKKILLKSATQAFNLKNDAESGNLIDMINLIDDSLTPKEKAAEIDIVEMLVSNSAITINNFQTVEHTGAMLSAAYTEFCIDSEGAFMPNPTDFINQITDEICRINVEAVLEQVLNKFPQQTQLEGDFKLRMESKIQSCVTKASS